MKRHLLFGLMFIMVGSSYVYRQIHEGQSLRDAIPYGVGFAVLWFLITGFVYCCVWIIIRPDRNPTRKLFGGRNDPKQTRRI
jgi:hypothetical protein